jgi:geranylgeranyl diphosphate synthase, type II
LASATNKTALPERFSPAVVHEPTRRGKTAGHWDRYGQLMHVAAAMFQPAELQRLAPRMHPTGALTEGSNGQRLEKLDPIAATEALAYDFLIKGGKHSRPFITLAVYDALTSSDDALPAAADYLAQLSPSVKRCALSIETFHKASLVHDDIQDDDDFRYGVPTLHRTYGIATAINVGDYLIGLGYRLVSREGRSLGYDVAGDILDRLAEAHLRLSEGQGAELLWRDSRNKQLTPTDALRIYALKTAPAFEAALHTGLRLAGPTELYRDSIGQFARNLGIAFQIINDLNDWHSDNHNKLSAAGDVIGGRPTVLWALALERLSPPSRARLEALANKQPVGKANLQEICQLYEEAGVFHQANRLIEQHQHRAEAIAEQIEPEPLRRLLDYLIELVLERRNHHVSTNGKWTPAGPAA